jgi:hypothetical protein
VPDTEHWREWLRQAELAANQCRTSDDIVEEVPMPRALRRHGYGINCELHDCENCANHSCSMSPTYASPLLKKMFRRNQILIRTPVACISCYTDNHHSPWPDCITRLTMDSQAHGARHMHAASHTKPRTRIFSSPTKPLTT